jgi:hypothetical protein
MGLFNKLFGRDKSTSVHEALPCPHTAIVPRWANAEDMGKADRITTYYCQACGETFTPEALKAAR